MYETHYKLKSDPFRLRPRAERCFQHASYAKALSYLLYALQRGEGLLLVTGMPGTGKTTLVRDCVTQSSNTPVQFVEISSGRLDAEGFVFMLAHKLGIPAKGVTKVAQLIEIENRIQQVVNEQKRVVLLIDEAQSLTNEALDEVKNLANMEHHGAPLMQIFLIGQNSLKQRLKEIELAQVMQRITAACELKPMTADDMTSYIKHCLRESGWSGLPKIGSSIVSPIFWNTGGIPRRVNLICSRLLLRGMVQNSERLDENDVEAVLRDLREEGLMQTADPKNADAVGSK